MWKLTKVGIMIAEILIMEYSDDYRKYPYTYQEIMTHLDKTNSAIYKSNDTLLIGDIALATWEENNNGSL